MEPGEKPLYWVGASKRDLMAIRGGGSPHRHTRSAHGEDGRGTDRAAPESGSDGL